MFLSEAETEARLDELRRQRAALDRAIAEHELYLDLGRRLARPGAEEPVRPAPAPAQAQPPDPRSEPARTEPPRPGPAAAPVRPDPAQGGPAQAGLAQAGLARSGPAPQAEPPGAAARREGRRLIEAAEGILAEAGRPMHAAEIWERLAARGLTLPGHDPVAALNTRLWKRAQGGSVFRRLGDAVYGLAS